MKSIETKMKVPHHTRKAIGVALALLLILQAMPAWAQAQPAHQHPATNAPSDVASLQAQLGQLRNQVADLARIIQSHSGAGSQTPGGGMPGMASMPGGSSAGGMGMMEMDKMRMGMGGMKGGGGMGAMQGMGDPGGAMGMMDMDMMKMMGMKKGMEMMGMMGGMQGMNMPSALPGFPGASHLYHIGATGFFLDHPEHITLTTEQQTALNTTKERAALAKNTSDREMAQAEQELWELTSSGQPDISKIEAKVREIEKLRVDARLAFIRSVGEAAKILTDEQRKVLVGQSHPAGQAGSPSHQHKP